MRIVLLASALSIHTQRWANGLAGRGHEIHLVSQHPILAGYHPAVVHHGLPWQGRAGYFFNAPAFRRLCGEIRPDLVNTHYASGYGTLSRLAGRGPVLLSVWGSDVFRFPRTSPLHYQWLKQNLAAAHRIASISVAMADEVKRLLPGVSPIFITPWGIDIEAFRPRPRPVEDDQPIRIGTVKTLLPTYGIDVLLRAFALLRARVDPSLAARLRLEIIGAGAQRAELERLASSLDLQPCTLFLGAVAHDDIPTYLARFDVFAALSRSESFGVAVLEASACERPVVVSDAGGLPEVVDDGVTGMVVPREDAEAAAVAFSRLVEDATLRQRMGHAGREFVARRYTWAASLDAMEQAMASTVGSWRR